MAGAQIIKKKTRESSHPGNYGWGGYVTFFYIVWDPLTKVRPHPPYSYK